MHNMHPGKITRKRRDTRASPPQLLHLPPDICSAFFSQCDALQPARRHRWPLQPTQPQTQFSYSPHPPSGEAWLEPSVSCGAPALITHTSFITSPFSSAIEKEVFSKSGT